MNRRRTYGGVGYSASLGYKYLFSSSAMIDYSNDGTPGMNKLYGSNDGLTFELINESDIKCKPLVDSITDTTGKLRLNLGTVRLGDYPFMMSSGINGGIGSAYFITDISDENGYIEVSKGTSLYSYGSSSDYEVYNVFNLFYDYEDDGEYNKSIKRQINASLLYDINYNMGSYIVDGDTYISYGNGPVSSYGSSYDNYQSINLSTGSIHKSSERYTNYYGRCDSVEPKRDIVKIGNYYYNLRVLSKKYTNDGYNESLELTSICRFPDLSEYTLFSAEPENFEVFLDSYTETNTGYKHNIHHNFSLVDRDGELFIFCKKVYPMEEGMYYCKLSSPNDEIKFTKCNWIGNNPINVNYDIIDYRYGKITCVDGIFYSLNTNCMPSASVDGLNWMDLSIRNPLYNYISYTMCKVNNV